MKKLILLPILLLCIGCGTNTSNNTTNTDTLSEKERLIQGFQQYLDSSYKAHDNIKQNLRTILPNWLENLNQRYLEYSSLTNIGIVELEYSRFEYSTTWVAWNTPMTLLDINGADSILKLASNTIKQITEVQFAEFPTMRYLYTKWCADKYWIDDIDVKLSGKRNQYIHFIGSEFSTNRNIQEFHDQLKQTFELLRFEQVRYSRYAGDGYTYYMPFKGKDSDPITTVLDSDYAWGIFPNTF